MKHATISVTDERGALVWSGSLYRFARDNQMPREDVALLMHALTTLANGQPQPVIIGGGAAPLFYLSLVCLIRR